MCQHCGQNEASVTLMYNFNGRAGELHLCPECARRLHGQYMTRTGGFFANLFSEGSSPSELPGAFGPQGVSSPEAAGEKIKARREISALKSRLKAAVTAENYEEAAKLRDQINNIQKGAYTYDI